MFFGQKGSECLGAFGTRVIKKAQGRTCVKRAGHLWSKVMQISGVIPAISRGSPKFQSLDVNCDNDI